MPALSKKYLGDEIEILELQDLQAVTGLKAIRVNVLYHKSQDDKIISNRFLSVSRAGWAPNPGPVLSGAVEVIDVSSYGMEFYAPVGDRQ